MRGFTNGQRVVVTKPTSAHQKLKGKNGTVCHLLMRSAEAWVNMDEAVPLGVGPFAGYDDPRKNHVCLWPGECEAL